MKILIVSATFFEIKPITCKLKFTGQEGESLFHYRHHDREIDILVTGIGMIATAFQLGLLLGRQNYDLAINAGLAGSFDPTLPVGSVVAVVEDTIAEFGAEDGEDFLSVFDLGFFGSNQPPYSEGKLKPGFPVIPGITADPEHLPLKEVTGITSNTIRGSVQGIERIRKISPASVESMEGAAFLHCCILTGIPCLQVRSISNMVEVRDRSKWNLPLAVKNLNDYLSKLLLKTYYT